MLTLGVLLGMPRSALPPTLREFLGYVDSGMMGEPTNEARGSFWSAVVTVMWKS